MNFNKNTIICCNCGHFVQGEDGVKGDVYFPIRQVILLNKNVFKCNECGNSTNVVLYGEEFISCLLSKNENIHTLAHVKQSNEIWRKKNKDNEKYKEANY